MWVVFCILNNKMWIWWTEWSAICLNWNPASTGPFWCCWILPLSSRCSHGSGQQKVSVAAVHPTRHHLPQLHHRPGALALLLSKGTRICCRAERKEDKYFPRPAVQQRTIQEYRTVGGTLHEDRRCYLLVQSRHEATLHTEAAFKVSQFCFPTWW